MVRVKHILLAVLAIAAVTLSVAGCETQKAKTDNTVKQAPKKVSHALSKQDEAKLFGDIQADIKLLEDLREDSSKLAEGFAGQALTNMVNANNSDLAAGKIKVRVFKKSKLDYSFAAPKIAAVAWTYTDGSYYIDKNTKQQLTSPTNKKLVFNLAAVKEKDRWKIGQVMLPAKKESGEPAK